MAQISHVKVTSQFPYAKKVRPRPEPGLANALGWEVHLDFILTHMVTGFFPR